MKIHYLSCHSVLEYDEVQLLTELGHEVFSNGAYLNPEGHYLLPRPGIKGAKHFPEYEELARLHPKTKLTRELVEPFDLIIVMHSPEFISGNWQLFKELKKTIVWRSIGQSSGHVEKIISFYKADGLKIIRYSPKEHYLPNYAGEDDLIRFYKDPEELKDWNGKEKKVINFTQSLKGRRAFCHYDEIVHLMDGFEGVVYGTGNDDLGSLNGGELPYEVLKQKIRDSRVFVYGGSWPAPYTLAFMEALMTGIPVVAIGKKKAEEIKGIPYLNFYEVSDIIQDGYNGFCSDDIEYLKQKIKELLNDDELAQRIGARGRETAINLFGKTHIAEQWKKFLEKI